MAGVNSRFAVVTEGEILQMFNFLEYVVLLPSLYVLYIIILFNRGEHGAFRIFTLHSQIIQPLNPLKSQIVRLSEN